MSGFIEFGTNVALIGIVSFFFYEGIGGLFF